MSEPQPWEEHLRKQMAWAVVVSTAVFAGLVFWIILDAGTRRFFDEVTLQHFPTIIGLPAAALASLGLVILLRTVSGSIEFKAFGFEFKGAAGPIIMWIFCFLAITFGISKTWNLK
jgi:cytosine/uracil/thiamine/allantoin permease